jgi:hypothetical protein
MFGEGIMGDSMCSTGPTFIGNRWENCGSPRTGMIGGLENGNTNRTKGRPYRKDLCNNIRQGRLTK